MWRRIVQIDYEVLVDHLLESYADYPDVDVLTFNGVERLLSHHVECMMGNDDNLDGLDDDLSNILLHDFVEGVVTRANVTSTPGVVVMRNGRSLMLPLVIIEILY